MQFFSTVVNILVVNSVCGAKLGIELWNGAAPKRTFQNGIFQPAECAFNTILEIKAISKKISSISPEIEKCTNLKTLDLRDNKIVHLPAGMLRMKNDFDRVLLDGNPVSRTLIVS